MMEVDAPSEHVEASRSVHMSLYKKKGANWREELRKKCAQHLRERREEAVSKARGLNEAVEREEINKIIREEIEAMRRSEQFEDEDLNAAIEDFEQIREELLQQELDDLAALEQERLEADVASYFADEVICPSCQMSPLLYFDACTVTCERCEFYFHLPVEMPCAAELSAYFMQIFNTHTNRKCDVVPSVIVQGPRMYFMCANCGFSYTAF
uniref:RPA-interacting protein C-terminal domain-containing protein n=1 Tax=Parascaris univalens TaxID=6257 RepID=A0A915AXH1_PARUN